jgi:hypothetical protein
MSDEMPKAIPLIPEPPGADTDHPVPPIAAHRLDFAKLGLPEYRNKCVHMVGFRGD